MYCSNCGNEVDKNAYVCIHCGVVLKKRSNNIKYKNNVIFNIFSLLLVLLQ